MLGTVFSIDLHIVIVLSLEGECFDDLMDRPVPIGFAPVAIHS